MGTHAGEKTANILINPKEKSQVNYSVPKGSRVC